ncbi:MAG: iron-containing alcohol dehydrogenase [Thermodesulfobacteria bacterium]|nr:iron-containing alcohol dehydrogenase [Thermodesulfobacteriota bacterium]
MENFEFHNPTKIVFGSDALDKIGPNVKGLGDKCLIVTGRESAKKSGGYDKVKGELQKAGIECIELTGVQSNPVLSKVYEGIEMAKKENVDFVVAIGGGSVMDTAKAISAGALLDGDIWDVFQGKMEIETALPVVCIPTLAASGSEMNGFMVITNEETGHKLAAGAPAIYPKVSFLNPELTFTVPKDYTAYGGVDAICHLLEPYFNGPDPYTPVQDEIAEGLIRTIMTVTRGCLDKPHDYQKRAALMWAATLALNGLTRAGVGEHPFPVHLIEHALSAIYKVPHGAGLAALLPGWMKWKATYRGPEKVAQFGAKCLACSGKKDIKDLAFEAADTFAQWLESIECPKNLGGLNIPPGDHEKIAENALFQSKIWGIENDYSKEVIMEILSFCQ